jgi:hypothetical protein
MSKNKIHWEDLSHPYGLKYACNHAVEPREDYVTIDVSKVNCKNCKTKIAKYRGAFFSELQPSKVSELKPSSQLLKQKLNKYKDKLDEIFVNYLETKDRLSEMRYNMKVLIYVLFFIIFVPIYLLLFILFYVWWF